MMIKQWLIKNKIVTILLIAVAVLIVYGIAYLSIIKPMQDELVTKNTEVDMFEKQYRKIANNNSQQEQLSDIAIKIPNQKAPDDVLLNLQKIASLSQVTLNLIQSNIMVVNQEEKELPTGVLTSTYSLEASANNLEDINTFLTSIKNSERLSTVEMISIANDGKEILLSLTFTTYYTK